MAGAIGGDAEQKCAQRPARLQLADQVPRHDTLGRGQAAYAGRAEELPVGEHQQVRGRVAEAGDASRPGRQLPPGHARGGRRLRPARPGRGSRRSEERTGDDRCRAGGGPLRADPRRDQLRLRLVPHLAQAVGAVGLPHDRGRPARPRAVDGRPIRSATRGRPPRTATVRSDPNAKTADRAAALPTGTTRASAAAPADRRCRRRRPSDRRASR